MLISQVQGLLARCFPKMIASVFKGSVWELVRQWKCMERSLLSSACFGYRELLEKPRNSPLATPQSLFLVC